MEGRERGGRGEGEGRERGGRGEGEGREGRERGGRGETGEGRDRGDGRGDRGDRGGDVMDLYMFNYSQENSFYIILLSSSYLHNNILK